MRHNFFMPRHNCTYPNPMYKASLNMKIEIKKRFVNLAPVVSIIRPLSKNRISTCG